MSTTSTRFLFTAVWLATVFIALTTGFPDLRVARRAVDIDPPPNPLVSGVPARAGEEPPDGLVQWDSAASDGLDSGGDGARPGARRGNGGSRGARLLPPRLGPDSGGPDAARPSGSEPAPGATLRLLEPHQPPADRLVAEAQAATAAGRHASAAGALRRLAVERPLTPDESRWLAGQADAAGHDVEALLVYYAIVSRGGHEPAAWERIGDLELQNGRPWSAAAAYSKLDPARRTAAVWVKLARAEAAAGDADAALSAYASALSGDPENEDALTLEAARYAATLERPAAALDLYTRQSASAQARSGMPLEMAQAALAANRPADALRLTSAALTAGDSAVELRYAHAQALHMTGQPGAAATVLRALEAERPGDTRFVAWRARTLRAEGRHLAAYELFSDVLRGDTSADVLVERGEVAATRGDVARARADYARAGVAGADDRTVNDRLNRLDVTPRLSLPFEYLRDSNDIEWTAQTARLDLWTRGPLHLAARGLGGRVRQGATSFATSGGAIDLDRWWITPRLSVAGSTGFSNVASRTLPAWSGSARYAWTDAGSIAVRLSRHTPWSGDPSRELMRFSRVHDLSGVGPGFDSVSFGGELEVPFGAHRGLRADLGSREYSDGNRSRDVFLQFQQVVADGPTWVAVQPHVYVERWRQTSPAYYSPELHTTTGVTLRAIGRQGIWMFDTAISPQLLTSNGRTGFGTNLIGGLRVQLGEASIGASAMFFTDRRYQYDLGRLVADARIPIGR